MSIPRKQPPAIPGSSPSGRRPRRHLSASAPIYLSAFVMPGLGQFIQRRWLAGTILATAFLVALLFFLGYAIRILVSYYSFIDFTADIDRSPPLTEFLFSVAGAFAVWLVSLIDVCLAYARKGRRGQASGNS